MRILGVDPGLAKVGYAIIQKNKKKINLIECGCLKTQIDSKPNRLFKILDFFEKLIINKKPQILVIENLYFFRNKKTATVVSETKGVILAIAGKYGLKTVELSPSQIKQKLVNFGRATKKKIKEKVQEILNQPIDSHHASDALAAAICFVLLNLNASNYKNK